jgi:transcriptional regulator with XRE-family HTH domain
MSRVQAAEKVGMSRTTYSSYERDEQRPSVDVFPALAAFLNITVEDFLTLYGATVVAALRPSLERVLLQRVPSLVELPGSNVAHEDVQEETWLGTPAAVPVFPDSPRVPDIKNVPDIPDVPDVPDVPKTPDVTDTPMTPETPQTSQTHEVPPALEVPEAPAEVNTEDSPSPEIDQDVPELHELHELETRTDKAKQKKKKGKKKKRKS